MDRQIAGVDLERVDFIKLDTQGSELDILHGAAETLGRGVLGIEVEVEFVEMYLGQPLFRDVDRHLNSMGFELIDLCNILYGRRVTPVKQHSAPRLFAADALYFPGTKLWEAMLAPLNESQRRDLMIRALWVCQLYDRLDHGWFLYQPLAALFDIQDRSIIEQWFRDYRRQVTLPVKPAPSSTSSPWARVKTVQ